MAGATVYKVHDPSAPKFPTDFKVVKRAVLQKTDLGANNNKYYNVELHDGGSSFRVFTHYGRTDDLETKPDAGVKECRFFSNLGSAQSEYDRIFREKTGPKKGYQEVNLASTKIGSQEARGKSSGEIDEQTKSKLASAGGTDGAPQLQAGPPVSSLPSDIRELVRLLYSEATGALTSTVQATITAKGVETPLGVLTIGQIEKGEKYLAEIYNLLKASGSGAALTKLCSAFYTAIPHRIGRQRGANTAAIISDLAQVAEKQETLQLMRDMLVVSGSKADVLVTDDVDQKYTALGCEIQPVTGGEFEELRSFVMKSQVRNRVKSVVGIFSLKRPGEHGTYEQNIGNHRNLFHGSRARNWMGLLSRGILLPKIVQTMGVNRTDAGWLGNGLYFGDSACTPVYYTSPSKRGTRFMTVAQVALGVSKDFTKITYGLDKAPPGFDSCHGVRQRSGLYSDFADDEFVVYRTTQQKMLYLVEFNA